MHTLGFKVGIESQLTRYIFDLAQLWKGDQKHKTHLQGKSLRTMTERCDARVKHGLKSHLNLPPQSK